MKKVLIVSTVSRQFYLFEKGNIEVLTLLGYDVHAAANYNDENVRLNELAITRHHFDIERTPFSLKNLKAFKQLKAIMKSENFDIVHCHSPMGGVLARLAAKNVGINTTIYTAHGFHFYKGASLINWLVYYPIEKFLSKYTDILVTINKEDYDIAQKFKAKHVVYVPGIGVDIDSYSEVAVGRDEKREQLGIPNDTVVILSIGEMIRRKNHEIALRALANINHRNFIYLICGNGELESYLHDLARSLGIEKKVKFLGFRNDIPEICVASDVFLFPSYQEGLPVSVMEAMAAGLPIVCSEIRGNTDLIEHGKGGYLVKPDHLDGFKISLEKLIEENELRQLMGERNLRKVRNFDNKTVSKIMDDVYSSI